jgi:hypothetical protein
MDFITENRLDAEKGLKNWINLLKNPCYGACFAGFCVQVIFPQVIRYVDKVPEKPC